MTNHILKHTEMKLKLTSKSSLMWFFFKYTWMRVLEDILLMFLVKPILSGSSHKTVYFKIGI